MGLITRFLPTGITDINDVNLKIPVHKHVEKFLFDNWNNTLLNKNNIKFGYGMNKNVSTTAKNALKCYWEGNETTSLETNDTTTREVTKVRIYIESRHINNFAEDVPQDLITMRMIIKDIINTNRQSLQDKGIFLMTFIDNNEVTQDQENNYIYRMNLRVRCAQMFSKIQVEESTQIP